MTYRMSQITIKYILLRTLTHASLIKKKNLGKKLQDKCKHIWLRTNLEGQRWWLYAAPHCEGFRVWFSEQNIPIPPEFLRDPQIRDTITLIFKMNGHAEPAGLSQDGPDEDEASPLPQAPMINQNNNRKQFVEVTETTSTKRPRLESSGDSNEYCVFVQPLCM